jgi:hypothetical protein
MAGENEPSRVHLGGSPGFGPESEERRAHLDRSHHSRPGSPKSTEEARVLRTDDLFLGAFGLLRGGEVRDVAVHGTNGKRVAVFAIEGPGMEDVEREYFHG